MNKEIEKTIRNKIKRIVLKDVRVDKSGSIFISPLIDEIGTLITKQRADAVKGFVEGISKDDEELGAYISNVYLQEYLKEQNI